MKQRPSASSPVAATVVAFVLQLSALVAARAANLTNGIYGYWPLNEGAGTSVSDVSGNHPPGIVRQNNGSNTPVGLGINGTVWVTNSPRGTVAGFTGTDADGYIFLGPDIIPALGPTDDFTWSVWARSDQAANNDIIFGNRYMTNPPATEWVPREFIKFTGNQFEWHWNAATEGLDYAPNIGVQSNWMHHSVVKQGTNMTYYQNGVQLLTRTIAGAPSNPQPLCIGGQGIENWRGYVDEVMVFRRALSADDIALLYGLTFSGSYSDQLIPGPARAAGQSPAPNATGAPFNTEINVTVVEGTTKLNDSSVEFKVNGQVVAHTISARTDLAPGVTALVLKVAGPAPGNLYLPLSQVSVEVKFSDSAATPAQLSWSFRVQDYFNVPPSWAVSDVDTNKPGFLVRTHQLDDRRHVLGVRGGRIPPAESQLAGRIGTNLANMTSFTNNGNFVESGYINYNQNATERNDPASNIGNFGATSNPVKNENPFPGIPGTAAAPTDHAAAEVLAYVDLPAGPITMGVHRDDGFRLTMSPIGAPRDKLGVMIMEFDGTGTASHETTFVVQQAGRYAMRLMWYEVINDASLEWYTVKDGVRHLVNDSADSESVKAYFGRTGPEPAHVSVIDPFPFGSTLRLAFPDDPLHIEITDGATAVQTDSIILRIFGQAVTPTSLTKTGGKTTVEYLPPGGLWPPGSNVTVNLIYTHSSTVTNSWTNLVMNYVTLQDTLRTAVGTGQTNGMLWRTHQWERATARANTVAAAEDQLANQVNSANLSNAVNGRFEIDYVNFDQDGIARGYFSELQPTPRNAIELPIPGIPGLGTTGTNITDNIVGEGLTFLEFTNAGLYYMAVNHDDSYQLTVATTEGGRTLTNGPNIQLIGQFVATAAINATDVQNDNLLAVYVPQPGVWPFRLLYFVGTGAADVEWYQTDKRTGIGLINDPAQPTIRAFRSRSVQPPPATPPAISIARTPPAGLRITFEGTLWQADQAAGPFTQVTNATSPLNLTPTEIQKFYRSRR